MRWSLIALAAAWVVVFSTAGEAACPVGKKQGDRWCQNGMEWKCEKCGSEYCPIITGNRCTKDDPFDLSATPAFRRFLQTGAKIDLPRKVGSESTL